MKKTIVVDASVAIKWFIPEIYSDQARLILKSKYELCAPELIYLELGSVLQKKIRLKELTTLEAEGILKDFMRFQIETYGSKLLINSAWQLVKNSGTTIYDCLYLALANSRGFPLVTADKKFYDAIIHSKIIKSPRIVWIADFN